MISSLGSRILINFVFFLLCNLCLVQTSYTQDPSKKLPKYTVQSIGDSIEVISAGKKMDGFWIYLPEKDIIPANNVVLFMHGYGAFNPLLFGAWIRHLVQQGNIVIYPRYQKTLTVPRPRQFVNNSLTGLKDAFRVLADRGWEESLWSDLDVVGHSYGGVISMNMAEHQAEYGIPPIKNVMICNAGSGPFKAGVLDNYNNVEANLIMLTSQYDTTVGSKFTKRVERLTAHKSNKIYLQQRSFSAKNYKITSHHNEPYALDTAFDNGIRNYTVKKAFRVGQTNEIDTEGYWKLFDNLIHHGDDFIRQIMKQNEWSISEKYPALKLRIQTIR